MAIDINATYPGRVYPPNANYPYGSIKNETVPNSSDDGTPLDEAWGNDFEGLKQWLLNQASIIPSNSPDNINSSDLGDALISLISSNAGGGAADKINWPSISPGTIPLKDITFSAGTILADDGSRVIVLGSALNKKGDAVWAEGDNLGGAVGGVLGASETRHCFLIVKDSDGTVDGMIDTSPVGANIPAGWSIKRRIHDLWTDGSSNIRDFNQSGDRIDLVQSINIVSTTTPSGTGATIQGAPSGSRKLMHASICLTDSETANRYVTVHATDQANNAATVVNAVVTAYSNASGGSQLEVLCDASGDFVYRCSTTNVTDFNISAFGWTDDRSE